MDESAVDRLAEIGARDLRAATRKLLHRQRMLETKLEDMAQLWHVNHCQHTHVGSYLDCYQMVCTQNREAMAARVFVNEPEATPR